MKRKGGDRCCLPNCQRGYRNCDTVRLFNFPSDEGRRQQWVAVCKLNKYDIKFDKARICDRHFAPKWLGRKFLKLGAVPTIDLPTGEEAGQAGPPTMFNLPETNRLWQAMHPPGGADEDADDPQSMEAASSTQQKLREHYCQGKVHGSKPCNAHVNDPPPICTECVKFFQIIKESERQYLSKSKELEKFRIKYNQILHKFKVANLQMGKDRRTRQNTLIPSRRRKMHQILEKAKHLNANTRSMCAMLMKTATTWREDEKDIAQKIYKLSPACYNYMRDTLNFHLPSKRCMERWEARPGQGENNPNVEDPYKESGEIAEEEEAEPKDEEEEEEELLEEDEYFGDFNSDDAIEFDPNEDESELEVEAEAEGVSDHPGNLPMDDVAANTPTTIEMDPDHIEYCDDITNYELIEVSEEGEFPREQVHIETIDASSVDFDDGNLIEIDPDMVDMGVLYV